LEEALPVKGDLQGRGIGVKIIEHIGGVHYDAQEVGFGKIHKWCPEGIVA
jgi:hypothetical protein